MRLFIGIWPPDRVTDALVEAQEKLGHLAPRGSLRYSSREQLHLTLRFLGETPKTQLEALQNTVTRATAGSAPFQLRAEGVGCFPATDRPRVVWVGITGDSLALGSLQQNVAAHVSEWAEKPEEREFHPHFTLARVKDIQPRERRVLVDTLARLQFPRTEVWEVASVRLVASELRPEGARYQIMAEIPLAQTR